MLTVRFICQLLPWIWLTLLTTSTAKPGCLTQCGNITVPYPFGIGLDGACSIGRGYNIKCNTTYDPPKPFIENSKMEIIDFSPINSQIRVKTFIAANSYNNDTKVGVRFPVSLDLGGSPLVFSHIANKYTLIGCDDFSVIFGVYGDEKEFGGGMISVCHAPEEVINGSCSGSGCAQSIIPKGLKGFEIELGRANISNVSQFNNCSYSFLGDYNPKTFDLADLSDPWFMYRTKQNAPIVLEWTVGGNRTCEEAQKDQSSYACKQNAICKDFNISTEGYQCGCEQGYGGNPYLGCTDIDECEGPNNPCAYKCANLLGSYKCCCPKGHSGDGHKNGTGCIRKRPSLNPLSIAGLILGFAFVLMLITWVHIMVKRNKHSKMREKFFVQNGGLLLKQQIRSQGDKNQESSSKIFSADELKVATNNYSDDRILGTGGYGMVYKGILKDGREVAIKKSRVADQTQIEQFINEVVILTQINHRNVVKLLGCCLETQVPLLVYEFISNGTLSHHIYKTDGSSWLSWAHSVRVASEAADAFAYLHSEASIPIIHRDVKSANILLDKSNTTKIADFGASRLIPIGRSEVTTLVQGTFGYLDPEYLMTSQLTDKSDVYSFGVVLAELLTKIRATTTQGNLSIYFLQAMKEGRLLEIVHPQLLHEASEEQLYTIGNLITRCLSVKADDRPTMKEVAMELEALKRQVKHLLCEPNYPQTSEGNGTYPYQKDYDQSTEECTEQYTAQMEMIAEMNHPR